MIFSERDKAKLRHIAGNPRVALSFNTDEEGGDVAVAQFTDAYAVPILVTPQAMRGFVD